MLAMRSVRGTVLNQLGQSDMDLYMNEENMDRQGLPKLTSETLLGNEFSKEDPNKDNFNVDNEEDTQATSRFFSTTISNQRISLITNAFIRRKILQKKNTSYEKKHTNILEKEQARQIKKFIDFEFELGRADVSNSHIFQSNPISLQTPNNSKSGKTN